MASIALNNIQEEFCTELKSCKFKDEIWTEAMFTKFTNGSEHQQDNYSSDTQTSQNFSQKKKEARDTRQEAGTHEQEACESITFSQQKKENSTLTDEKPRSCKTVTYSQPDGKIQDTNSPPGLPRRSTELISDGGLDINAKIKFTQKSFSCHALLSNILPNMVTPVPQITTPSKTQVHLLHTRLREQNPENQTADTAGGINDSVEYLTGKGHPPHPLWKIIDCQRPTQNDAQPGSREENLPQDKTKCYHIIDARVSNVGNMGGDNRLFEKDFSQHTMSVRTHRSLSNDLLICSLEDPADQDKAEQTLSATATLSKSTSAPTASLRNSKSVDSVESISLEDRLNLQGRLKIVKLSTKNEQPRSVHTNRADKRSEITSNKSVYREYDRLHKLHGAIALTPDSDFPADIGKADSLRWIHNATVDLLLSPGLLLSTKELPYWEIWRLGTFSEVEDLAAFAIRLAQTGFFYDTQLNDIICFSCGLRKRHWDKSEKPAFVHLSLSRHCKQANFEDERNMPIDKYPFLPLLKSHKSDEIMQDGENSAENAAPSLQASSGNCGEGQNVTTGSVTMTNGGNPPSRSLTTTTDQGRHSSTDTTSLTENPRSRASSTSNGSLTAATLLPPPPSEGAGAQTATPQLNSSPASSATDRGLQRVGDDHGRDGHAWTESILDMQRLASPSNATVSARIKSFLSWPVVDLPNSRHLVHAGFYYLGVADSVRCFCCGVTLRRWKENDDPWAVHVRFRFSCEYVKAIKGDEFVCQTLIQLATERQNGSAASNGEEPSPSSGTNGSLSASGSPSSASTEASTTSHPAPRVTQASVAAWGTSASNQVSGGDASSNTPDQSGQHQSVEGPPGTVSSASVLNSTDEPQPRSGGTKYTGVGSGNLGTGGKGTDGLISANAANDYSDATWKAVTHIGAGIPSQDAIVAYVGGEAYTGSRQHGSTANQIATGSTANQIATDGTANHFTTNNSSITNGNTNSRNAANQGRDNRATANQDRGRIPPANQTATNAIGSTQGEEGNARNPQSDQLQSDSEPTLLPQGASQSSLPSMTATQQNNSRRQETTVSGSSAQREHPGSSRPSRLSDGNRDQRAYLQQLQEDNRRLRHHRTCRVCGERDVDTIFMPCGHLCTCGSCASAIHNCCLCNRRIRATARVYLE